MKKQDFKKKFPDVCVQEITFEQILSRAAIETKVLALIGGLQTGLLYYESYGKELTVFTSYQFRDVLNKMVEGEQVLGEDSDIVGTIISPVPFICNREMCVRVSFGDRSDIYPCNYLQLLK